MCHPEGVMTSHSEVKSVGVNSVRGFGFVDSSGDSRLEELGFGEWLEGEQVVEVVSPSYRDWETDRKSTRLNSSHITRSRMPSSA